jgi:hypothetical protein|tara:strand:- start:1759 stop:2625 length:867 start_codon:yes stop_codon:yes gene_type:complete
MKNEIIVHPGYSKTATTWLQDEIFAELGAEIYLGKTTKNYPRWILEIIYLDDATFDRRINQLRETVRKKTMNKPISIISSEAFTNLGAVHSQARRIRKIFGQAKIILVLRNPISWIISNYKCSVQFEKFYKRLEDILDYAEKRTPLALEKRPPFYLPDYFYDETVETYISLFGLERVLILRYEDFRENPREFGQRLEEFTGVSFPNFEKKSEKRILVSLADDEIERIRLQNLYNLFYKQFPSEPKVNLPDLKNISVENPILSSATEIKLKNYFKEHCSKYYPELSECD